MTATTSAPRVAQRDDTPASQVKTLAVASALPQRPTADYRLGAQLITAIGAGNDNFLGPLYYQLAGTAFREEEINEGDLRFMCSVVTGLKPCDQLEYMLAAQMAAVHLATMTSALRLRVANNPAQRDSAERTFNKLARTFATQMEAFKRYRTGAEQKVVQHVSIGEGSQAIVGNVTHAPRENAGNGGAPRT